MGTTEMGIKTSDVSNLSHSQQAVFKARFPRWLQLIAITGSAQAVVQALGLFVWRAGHQDATRPRVRTLYVSECTSRNGHDAYRCRRGDGSDVSGRESLERLEEARRGDSDRYRDEVQIRAHRSFFRDSHPLHIVDSPRGFVVDRDGAGGSPRARPIRWFVVQLASSPSEATPENRSASADPTRFPTPYGLR